MNMEIPDMKMMSDFECMQNPTLISRFFSLSGIGKVPQVFSIWKWGAVILLLFATLRSLIKRLKLIFIHFYSLIKPSPRPLIGTEDFEFSDDDDCSSISSEEEEDNSQSTSFSDRHQIDGDFSVKGSSFYRRNGSLRYRRRRSSGGDRFAWSEFTSGKNVVKLWDSLGLGLNFLEDSHDDDDNSTSVVSVWNFDKEAKNQNSFGGSWDIPAMAMGSPAVVLTAVGNGVVLGAYDTRMPRGIPAICAEWATKAADAVGVSAGGVEKVYVRNGVSGALTVGDMRKLKKPIEDMTAADGETWWDADAVIVDDEFELVEAESS